MKEVFVFFKPAIECLTLHQLAWEEKTIVGGDHDGLGVTLCRWCNKMFHYPTKKTDHPVY